MNRRLGSLLLSSLVGCSSTGATRGADMTPEPVPEPEACDFSTICEEDPIPVCDPGVSGTPLHDELERLAERPASDEEVVVLKGFIRPSALTCTGEGCLTPCCNACGGQLLLLPAPDAKRDDGDDRLWLFRAGEPLSCSERCCGDQTRVCCTYQSEGSVLVTGRHRFEDGTRGFELTSICRPEM